MAPLKTLTFAAALAPDVRVGSGILVLPLRNPVLLAREIAILNFLTGGRFVLGLGPSWYPPAFAALTGNKYLIALRKSAATRSFRVLFLSPSSELHLLRSARQHEGILHAVERGQAGEVARLM